MRAGQQVLPQRTRGAYRKRVQLLPAHCPSMFFSYELLTKGGKYAQLWSVKQATHQLSDRATLRLLRSIAPPSDDAWRTRCVHAPCEIQGRG